MTEFAIACGCGRKMTPDGLAGYGAFRCGCGARVRASVINQPAISCVGAYGGEPCRNEVRILDPFPLCEEHHTSSGLEEYKTWSQGTPHAIAEEIGRRVVERAAYYKQLYMKEHGLKKVGGRVILESQEPIVYFIRSGDLVKIGTTVDLVARMKTFNLPTLTVLATEPGYHARERELHKQFKALRYEREWFRLEEPLISYINEIRRTHSLPDVAL